MSEAPAITAKACQAYSCQAWPMRRRSSTTPTRMRSLFFMTPLRRWPPAYSLADHHAGKAQQVVGLRGLALLAQLRSLLDGRLGFLRLLGADRAGLEAGLGVLERLVAALCRKRRQGDDGCNQSEQKHAH